MSKQIGFWSDCRDALLRELVGGHRSIKDIQTVFGLKSHLAVVNRARKLGLLEQLEEHQQQEQGIKLKPVKRFKERGTSSTNGLHFLQLKNGVCKMPLWKNCKPNLENMFYCGKPTNLSTAWCTECKAQIYKVRVLS